jgi:uncharacterized LabA/DUF88 family protein
MKRVRIFVDHQNFTIGWRKRSSLEGFEIRWERLPHLVMSELEKREFLNSRDAELRGVTVYASVDPRVNCTKGTEHHFLKYELDQLPSYTVKISDRQERRCSHDPTVTHTVEKGVDTKIVCDMLALAMRDHYDVGVIISDDADLVPSVQCVQDILDRQIVHLGFQNSKCQDIRSAAWGHIIIDSFVNGLKGPRKLARSGTESGASAIGDALQQAISDRKRRRRRRTSTQQSASPETAPCSHQAT